MVKFMLKKLTISVFCLIMAASSTVYAQNPDVYINGQRLDSSGVVIDGSVYVPLRAVGERMGADVEWNNLTKSAHIFFSEENMISAVAQQVSPSVVAIVGNYRPSGLSSPQQNYNELTAHGTGVVIKSNGRILTNFHVVDGLENITVIFNDGSTYPANVLYTDSLSDLAVIQINKLGLTPITFAKPETIQQGNTVIAIGTPLSLSMRNTITRGIVSATDVSIPSGYYPLLQTDAAINPGNSGGPLINMRGECVGINSSKYSGIGIEGLAFSIPAETVNYVLDQFEKHGKVMRSELDITISNSWEANLGLPTKKGVTVTSSKTEALLAGDSIIAINDYPVHSKIDYNMAMRNTFSAPTVTVTYIRNGTTYTTEVNTIIK